MSTPTGHVKNPVFYREPPSITKEEGTFEVFCVDVPEGMVDPSKKVRSLDHWREEGESAFLTPGPITFTTKEKATKFINAMQGTSRTLRSRLEYELLDPRSHLWGDSELAKFLFQRFSHREVLRLSSNFPTSRIESHKEKARRYASGVAGIGRSVEWAQERFLNHMDAELTKRLADAMYNELLEYTLREKRVPTLRTCIHRVVDSGVADAIVEEIKVLARNEHYKSRDSRSALLSADDFAEEWGTPTSVELIKLSAQQRKELNTLVPRRPVTAHKLMSRNVEVSTRWIVDGKEFFSHADAQDHLDEVESMYHRRTLYTVQSLGYARVSNIEYEPVLEFFLESYDTDDLRDTVEAKAREIRKDSVRLYQSITQMDSSNKSYLYPENVYKGRLDKSLIRQRIADAMYRVAVDNLDLDENGDPEFVLPLEIVAGLADMDPILDEVRAMTEAPDSFLLHLQPRTARVSYTNTYDGRRDFLRYEQNEDPAEDEEG